MASKVKKVRFKADLVDERVISESESEAAQDGASEDEEPYAKDAIILGDEPSDDESDSADDNTSQDDMLENEDMAKSGIKEVKGKKKAPIVIATGEGDKKDHVKTKGRGKGDDKTKFIPFNKYASGAAQKQQEGEERRSSVDSLHQNEEDTDTKDNTNANNISDATNENTSNEKSPEISPAEIERRTEEDKAEREEYKKELEDVEPFDENTNPLTVLRDINLDLTKNTDIMKETDLLSKYEAGGAEKLKQDLESSGTALKKSSKFLCEFGETVEAIRFTMLGMTKLLKDSVQQEHQPYEAGQESDLQRLESALTAHQAHGAFTSLAQELVSLQRLGADIEQSCRRVEADLRKSRAEQEKLDKQAQIRLQELQAEEEEAERKRKEKEEMETKAEAERARREAEAEAQRLEQMRKQAEQHRAEMEKVDPSTWPAFTYKAQQTEGGFEGNVCCVVRAREGLLEKMMLECSVLPLTDQAVLLQDRTEDVISHVINIKTKGDPIDLQSPAWIALPRVLVKGQPHKLAVIKQQQPDGSWRELPSSRDTQITSVPDVKFIEAPFTSIGDLTLIVTNRLRSYTERFNNRGGKVQCAIDPRVAVHVPKGAYRLSADVTLKLMQIDIQHLNDLKSRESAFEAIQGTSGFVHIQASSRPHRPVLLSAPTPPGTSHKRRPQSDRGARHGTSGGLKPGELPNHPPGRPRSAWGGAAAAAKDEMNKAAAERLLIVIKPRSGEWRVKDDIKLVIKRDILHFEMQDIDTIDRFIVLRIKSDLLPSEISKLAEGLEDTLQDRIVNMVVRQKESDMEAIYIDIVKKESLNRVLAKVGESDYTYGPEPSKDIVVREGQPLQITMRGNLKFQALPPPIKFVYYSYLNIARRRVYITEIDRYAQHALDNYRGHVQFYSKCDVVKANEEGSPEDTVEETVEQKELLCELPLTLPKPPIEHACIQRIPVEFKEKGPFTLEYFELLSLHLGEEWRHLAELLRVNKARQQSIMQYNADRTSQRKNVLDMLICWYKNCAMSADKVSDLYWALRNAGRDDLALDLYERNLEFQVAAEQKAEDDRFKRAFKLIVESPVVLRDWKVMSRHLGLDEVIICDIEKKGRAGARLELCNAALTTWRQQRGSRAGMKKLIRTMRLMKLRDIADKVSLVK